MLPRATKLFCLAIRITTYSKILAGKRKVFLPAFLSIVEINKHCQINLDGYGYEYDSPPCRDLP